MSTSPYLLCEDLPPAFQKYMEYCGSLRFEDRPDYFYLRGLFKDLFKSEGFQDDGIDDWTIADESRPETDSGPDSSGSDSVPIETGGLLGCRDEPEARGTCT